jgi:hypothetical protein
MDIIFQRLIDNNFSELPGMEVKARVPVPERLLNEVIAVSLRENRNIEYCQVSVSGQNRVNANVKTPLWPWPFHLRLKLFREVDFSGSPKVRAFLENNVLLGKLGALLKTLPEGILIYEDQISVDLGALLQAPEQKRSLQLVKAIEISTETGTLIFDVLIKI